MTHKSIPKDVLKVLQSRDLTPYKRLVAYTMLVPGLPSGPAHTVIWETNLELGKKVKKLIENGTITVTAMNDHSVLEFKLSALSKS